MPYASNVLVTMSDWISVTTEQDPRDMDKDLLYEKVRESMEKRLKDRIDRSPLDLKLYMWNAIDDLQVDEDDSL